MTTQGWFSIPLHIHRARGEEFRNLQTELFDCYNAQEFSQIDNWTADTHELSKDPFTSNVTKNCPVFLSFVDNCVNNYLNDIGSHASRDYVITQSWFTKTNKGQYAHLHEHGGADISGVYYLQTNGKDGNLKFLDPHKSYSSNYIFECLTSTDPELPLEEGLVALWPGLIQHRTEPNDTDDVRISLAFNISFRRRFDLL